MRRDTIRYLALLLALALGAGLSLTLDRPLPEIVSPAGNTLLHLYHVDVGDWYRTTPEETVVRARYDLATPNLATSLPRSLDSWQAENLGPDEDIEEWFGHPDVQLRWRFGNSDGESIWLTVIGSRGAKSFRIFEHTPHICYQASGWQALDDSLLRIPLDTGSLPVRRGLFERQGHRVLVYYWYQWDGPSRDSADGVASWRLTTEIADDQASASHRLDNLVNSLYAESMPWHRF